MGMQGSTTTAQALAALAEDRLLRPEQAAWYLNVKTSWVYEAVRAGRLPCHRVSRHIRFTCPMLDNWLAEQPRQLGSWAAPGAPLQVAERGNFDQAGAILRSRRARPRCSPRRSRSGCTSRPRAAALRGTSWRPPGAPPWCRRSSSLHTLGCGGRSMSHNGGLPPTRSSSVCWNPRRSYSAALRTLEASI